MSGEQLFIGSCAGKFYALDRRTGKELWSYDTRADGGPRSFHGDPLLYKDMVVFTTDRGCGPKGGFVYAFEQQTGKLRWKIAASGPSTSLARLNGSGVFGTRQDEWQSVDLASGKLKWVFALASADPDCEFRKSPVTDGVNVYFLTHDNKLHAVSPSGENLWTYTPSAPVTTALFMYKDVLYLGAGERLYGIDPATAKVHSELKVGATLEGAFGWGHFGGSETEYLFATRQENGHKVGLLMGFSDEFESVLWTQKSAREWSSEKPHVWRRAVIVGNCRGELTAYGATNGALLWTDSLKGCIRSIGDDGALLYVGTQEGTVYAYAHPSD